MTEVENHGTKKSSNEGWPSSYSCFLSKSHSSWLQNSIERVGKCKQMLIQHKRQPHQKMVLWISPNIYIFYCSKQAILIMKMTKKKKKPCKMAKMRVNRHSIFSYQVCKFWQMHTKFTWHTLVTVHRKTRQQFHYNLLFA